MNLTRILCAAAALAASIGWHHSAVAQQGDGVGVFESHADVGNPAKPGSVEFDAAAKTYKIAGGGTNMWANTDAFHFAWKKMSGDVSLAADIVFPTPGGDAHRKAVLILRQTLDADSPYVDAALHGDGLTSLQYRETKGGRTSEVQAKVKGPKRLRIEKRGQDVSLWVGDAEPLKRSGATIRLKLEEPFYVGLGVCAHDNAAIETAVFSNVELGTPPAAAAAPPPGGKPQVLSTPETIAIASKDRRVVRTFDELVDAPT
jgi:hypothetical protein